MSFQYERTGVVHMACKEEQFDVVQLMVSDQFNFNSQLVNGKTPSELSIHIRSEKCRLTLGY